MSMIQRLSHAFQSTIDFALPQHCVACRQAVPASDRMANGWPFAMCCWCRASLPGRTRPRCPVCAVPQRSPTICPDCQQSPPPFAATLALGDYAPPLNYLVQHFKYRRRIDLGRVFSQLLYERLTGDGRVPALPTPRWPNCIVPIPLTAARLRQRGYNQAATIARDLATRSTIAPDWHGLYRVSVTSGNPETQTSKSRQERLRDVPGRFLARDSVYGKRVLLIDDVMTTGATTRTAATALIDAGAISVVNLIVARTA